MKIRFGYYDVFQYSETVFQYDRTYLVGHIKGYEHRFIKAGDI